MWGISPEVLWDEWGGGGKGDARWRRGRGLGERGAAVWRRRSHLCTAVVAAATRTRGTEGQQLEHGE